MDKKCKVIYKGTLLIVAVIGVLNLVDYIYASSAVDAATSGITASATINPSSTVSLSANSVSLDITPSAAGTLKSNYLTVSAYTNTTNNCTVQMTTSSTNLTSGSNTIATLSSAVAEGSFTNDRWGFRAGDSGNYNPVATTNTIATYTTNTGSTAQTKKVYFAAKLTAATKPGTYSNTVTFTSTCAQS